ncbi:MAG TPA: hypothetical protein VKB86_19255, partial [Pyrinomonadaceae bacterium]|nr:hypothetical protein [Pyrinomonadaceae bacterium]
MGSGTYGGIGLGITSFSNCQNYALLSEGTNLFVNAPSGSGTIHIRAGNNSNSGNDNVTILSDGKVGIGTTSPTKALDVHGDINVTGNIAAKYQDVAEWVPSTHALAAGTVVILNPDKSNQVMASIS